MIKLKKISKYIIIILLLLLNTSCSTTTLKDDYYTSINKEILDNNKIEIDKVGWSVFSHTQEKVDDRVFNIVKNATTNPRDNIELEMSKLYKTITDTETRNNVAIKPLIPYINLINSSSNIEEFVKNAIQVERDLNIDIITRITISKDLKNSNKNIIYFYPITFDYGLTSDYYINSDYLYYHALLKQYNIKLLKQYGYTKQEARYSANLVDEFYQQIASYSKTTEELNDIENCYNIIDQEKLKEIYNNIDINYYLSEMNIENTETFNIVDIKNYQALNSYLNNDNLQKLKEYVKLKILQNYAIYASDEYANLIYELDSKLQSLEQNSLTQEEKAMYIINDYFSYDIDKIYTNTYFSKNQEEYINKMIEEILGYYKLELENNNWLTNNTKKLAIQKLNNININVGISKELPNYTENYKIDDQLSLLENIININQVISEYTLSILKESNSSLSFSQTTVNAYYNPQDNSINFPASSALLFDIDDSYYENLGSIGMIIAHEITHTFDPNGAKFDENGNLYNWWTEEDYNKFNKLKEKVIDYYNKYEVIDGFYLDGKITVNENIADLGSLSCIVSIAKNKNASKNELKTMFKSFANLWASEYTEEYQKILLLQDTHSSDKYRVNATLSSIDVFYETYDIGIFDEMYISPDNRVKIW